MININKIETLLDSFYNGTTTTEEEKILTDYFLSATDIPQHLTADKELFIELSKASNLRIESKINALIDSLDKKEDIHRINWKWISGIAAGIALLISSGIVYFYNNNSIDNLEPKDTYTDVNKAYTEAESALLLVSEALNKGEAQYTKAEKKMDRINEILNKNIK
ncbi:MAG: hypothetical protein RR938_05575 [Muribaculaceae bacterium]